MNQKKMDGEFDNLAVSLREVSAGHVHTRINLVREFASKNGFAEKRIAERLAPGRIGSWRYYPRLEEFRIQVSCRRGRYGYADCVTLTKGSEAKNGSGGSDGSNCVTLTRGSGAKNGSGGSDGSE